ncbi:MAG: hypothetical protein IPI23_10190 [Bacteroidetes bacterium]|nr:hypothetical protein [Bacteroidota bacterium]
MKLKYILFIIILIGTSSSSFATSYTWVGTTSDWANSNNWYPSGIPDSADFVTISSGTYSPLLDGNRKITNLTLPKPISMVFVNRLWHCHDLGTVTMELCP